MEVDPAENGGVARLQHGFGASCEHQWIYHIPANRKISLFVRWQNVMNASQTEVLGFALGSMEKW